MIGRHQEKGRVVQALERLAGEPDGDSFAVSVKIRDEYLFDIRSADQVLHYALSQIVDKIAREVVIKTIGGMYTVQWDLSEIYDPSERCTDIGARLHLWKVKEVPVIYKVSPTINDLPRDVYSCKWCGGYTKNDQRGNCAACGAPRDGGDKAWGIGGECQNIDATI